MDLVLCREKSNQFEGKIWGYHEPTPAFRCFGPATPMQPGAALSAQAESRQDPTRVGSRPDPGFARLGEACPLLSLSASARRRPHCLVCLGCALPASLGFGQATPCSLARLLQRRLNLGRTPPEWAPGQNRPSPGRERLHPPPLPRRRPCPMARLRPRRLNLGWTPPEWAPSQTQALPCRRGCNLP